MDDRKGSTQTWMLITSLTIVAVALIAATGFYYLGQRSAMETAARQELAAVTEIKLQQLVNWRSERLGDGRSLQSAPIMRIATRLLSGPTLQPTDRADLVDAMKTLERQFLYIGAVLVDSAGAIRLESNISASDPSRIAEFGRAAAHSADVELEDFYWDRKLQRPLMALSVPVQHWGAFILTIDPKRFLYPFISAWPVPSRTAETLLIRIDGNRAVYLNDLRYKPGAALHYWRPLRSALLPDGRLGSDDTRLDYRGVPVVWTARKIPGSPWYLVAKIDRSEVDAPVWRLGWEMALIITLIALANAAGVGFFWRGEQIRARAEREEWLRQLLDETPAYLWLADREGNNSLINKALADYLGVSTDRLGTTWRDYYHPDDVARVEGEYLRSVAQVSVFMEEARLRRYDGEYRWFFITARPRFSPDGRFIGQAGSLLDVTERKAAEDDAREKAEFVRGQNRILELVVKNTPLANTLDELVRVIEALTPDMLGSILLLDSDGIHLRHGAGPNLPESYIRAIDGEPIGPKAGSCGTAAFLHKRVIVEDIATDPLWENYRDFALRHGLRACWSIPIFGESAKGADGRHKARNGIHRSLGGALDAAPALREFPGRDGDSSPVLGTFAFYFRSPRRPSEHDQKLIEMATQVATVAIVKTREGEALRRSEAQLLEAQQIAHIGSYEWDVHANTVDRSAELCNIFGVSCDEFEPTFDGYLQRVHPDDRSATKELVERSFRECTPFDHEERIVRPDGTVRVLRSQGQWLCAEDGRPLKLIGTCQDTTERKEAEQQLHRANSALEQELKERARTEKEIQELSARLINAQEEERSRLARELHDDLSQQIAALSVALSNLKRAIPSEVAEARSASERIREKLGHLGEAMRRLSHELHPALLQYSGLESALRAYCSEFTSFTRIRVAFSSHGSFSSLPPAIALCAYRVTQEALRNVHKHAQTDHAEVVLTCSGSTLTLKISDQGTGIDWNGSRPRAGLGITSMKERARLVNGVVDIQSRIGSGTTVTLTVSLEPDTCEHSFDTIVTDIGYHGRRE